MKRAFISFRLTQITDYENNLNYAYDDNHMRKLRVERLENGEAISTAPKANTVRSISRVRVIQDQDDEIVLRCAQNLREFRKETSSITRPILHTI